MPKSDSETTISELKDLVRSFVEERDWRQFHNGKDLAIGLSIEAAELLEHFRFKSVDEVTELLADPAALKEVCHELADIFYFVLALSDHLDIQLSEAFREKLEIARERYPVELAKGKNLKYTELQKGRKS
ncbi:nucleotide pyrophosphohydrolase [candidate division KSB1 bacterium]|nr:nucleotide pyrophosphohydrolase [candidate division KSB1 bacterium]